MPRTMPDQATGEKTKSSGLVGLTGMILAVLMGLVLGWLRYWLGFFVLIQGALCGVLLAWLIGACAKKLGANMRHPGFRPAMFLATLWLASFILGQIAGFGFAQPWFDPLGWLGRIWTGSTHEPTYAITATAAIHRAFAGKTHGGFWIFLNLLDLTMLLFLLLTLSFRASSPHRRRPAKAAQTGGR